MTEHITLAALIKTWPGLAERAGSEWPGLYWTLLDAVRAYLDAPDEDARARIAREMLARIGASPPAVREAIRQEMRALQAAPHERGQSATEVTSPDVLAEARQLVEPETVVRYTDVLAPARVQAGRRFAVIVGLTRSPSDDTQDPQRLQVELNKLIRVVLTPREPVEVIGERAQTMRVERDRDSAPVVFYLRVQEAGVHSALLDFYDAQGQLLLSQSLSTEVVIGAVADAPSKPAGAPLRLGDYLAPHPDLILRVTTLGDRLTYHLHFADTRMITIAGDQLQADPRTFRLNLMKEIEGLRKGSGPAGQAGPEIIRELERIGQWLYRQLFPEPLRREYCRFRNNVRTLQLISDEPWIPWELVRPYELAGFDGPAFEDDFLCARFDFSRWVMPGTAPAGEIAVRSLACLAPADSGLAAAQAERSFMQALARGVGATDASPVVADRTGVMALLEGETPIALWHFACHGDYDDGDPDQSPLHLQGRTAVRPKDLIGPKVEGRLSQDRPLVFLNACRVGSLGLALTGLGGWAATFVGNCRVGALVAPLWVVSDAPAKRFAEAFYAQSRQPGCTLAQAVRHARATVRDEFPGDPTWLAYSLYAHPNARLKWT